MKNNVEKEWIVIGQLDLETLVKTYLSSKQDWEKNFKALKVRGKEAERLPRYSTTLLFCLNSVFCQIKVIVKYFYSLFTENLKCF